MASRYPSGPDDSRTYQSAYAYTSYHSKSNYAPRSNSSNRPPARSPPPAVSRRQSRYHSPRTYTNSAHTPERPSPEHARSYHSSASHFNQSRPGYESSPRPQPDKHRGTHRGRQQSPRSSEYRYNPPRSYDRAPQSHRDQTRPAQTQHEPSRTSQYRYAHKGGSSPPQERSPAVYSPSRRGKRDRATQRRADKPHTALNTAPTVPNTEENKPTKVSEVKEQCSICLNDIKDQVSLKCDHSFCYECLVKWCATKETCPLCRSRITELRETHRSLPNQRMVATFVCSCGNKWKSSFAYHSIKQGCKKCGADVAASDTHPKTVISSPAPSTFLGLFPFLRESSSHKQELCGMCRLLGRDCSRQETLGDDEDLLDIVGLENLMNLFNLSDSPFDPGHEEVTWPFLLSDSEDYDIAVDWDLYDPIYCGDFDGDYSPFEDYEVDWEPDWDN